MEKGLQASLDKFVLLSKEEADSLKSRAKGAHNLNLHLQENDIELRKERKRSKELEKLLLEAHKRIGELTLEWKDGLSEETTDESESSGPVSSFSQFSSTNPQVSSVESSLQIDGGPLSYRSYSKGKSFPREQVMPQGKSHQVTYPEPRVFKFGNDINVSSSLKGTSDSVMKKNQMEESKLDCDTKSSLKETLEGVSVQYFNNLKMELIKTKRQLQRVLQQNHTDLNQVEIQRHSHQKVEALEQQLKDVSKEKDVFKEKVQSLYKDVTLYKTQLHQNIEGTTVNSQTSDSLSSVCLYDSRSTKDMVSRMSDSSCQTSPFLRPLVSPKWSSDNNSNTEENMNEKRTTGERLSPDPHQVMKDTQNRIQRLTKQLEDQHLLNERLIKENKDIKKSYQQLLKSVQDTERHHEQADLKTKKMQLEDENFKLKKMISEYEEDNNHLLSTIEVIQNNLCKERDRAMQLEATLREEQRCHGLTKHNLYVMYGNLKTKFDRLAHQKNLLEQRLANSSTGGPRNVTMTTGGTPDRHITPQSSFETDPNPPAEEIHIYENVARKVEPLKNQSTDSRLHQFNVCAGDPDHVVSVREPVESTHPYDDDLPQIRSTTPRSDSPVNVPSQYLCKRCLNEFDVEMDFLCHIEKCLID
ncbi:interaptin-like [Mizuhopecten yessoensis]|nr:interaptin-like [Mizuhopecten yessoensis]XP_021375713.1 interaptin-like [Mizuhopecten yessoensis]XP_021375714.1 interaptin-like [Mizuhopecten yessoensis]